MKVKKDIRIERNLLDELRLFARSKGITVTDLLTLGARLAMERVDTEKWVEPVEGVEVSENFSGNFRNGG